MPLYPIRLEPLYKEKVWGGRTLETFGRTLPGGADTRIGESWELVDVDSTSPSGGGGAAAHSKVCNGPLIKRTLDDVLRDFADPIMGHQPLSPDGRFPLLVKYLDARENLSVQVHPSASYAAEHPGAQVKSEAWYVVAAEPGAVIYSGFREGVGRPEVEAAIRHGGVEELLTAVPARAGACHYLPSGTCHALGRGVFVAEVSTPSDTTYRVFDWGRRDRDLHVEEALACMDFGPVDAGELEADTTDREDATTVRHMVRCAHFSIDEWIVDPGVEHPLDPGTVSVLMVIRGRGRIEWGGDERHALEVGPGQTVIIPAALTWGALSAHTEMTLLRVTLPEPV